MESDIPVTARRLELEGRWLQFSLRTLLLFVTVCAILCSWLAVRVRQAKREREATQVIRRLSGSSYRADRCDDDGQLIGNDGTGGVYDTGGGLRGRIAQTLGREWAYAVVNVDLSDCEINDDDLATLESFPGLKWLGLGRTEITDRGLKHLAGLKSLRSLELCGAKVTDAGLSCLTGLTQLRSLRLDGTNVTDSGLQYLGGLNNLQSLNLSETKVAGAKLYHLEGLEGLSELWLDGTDLSDSTTRQLARLGRLRTLGLSSTQVTDAGLKHLAALQQLESLSLYWTQTTEAGRSALQRSVPNLSVQCESRDAQLQSAIDGLFKEGEDRRKRSGNKEASLLIVTPPKGAGQHVLIDQGEGADEVGSHQDEKGRGTGFF